MNQAVAELALNLYRECLRKVLTQRGGYECQETEGSFMLAFYNCTDAAQFCVLVSLAEICVQACEMRTRVTARNMRTYIVSRMQTSAKCYSSAGAA